MSGNTSKQKEKVKSYIRAEFTAGGSALFDLGIENISPNQISALIGYLDAYSKVFYTEQIVQNLRAAQEQQLSVPKPNIQVAK